MEQCQYCKHWKMIRLHPDLSVRKCQNQKSYHYGKVTAITADCTAFEEGVEL